MAAGAANRRSDMLALGSFVVLGLPDGILGTAWPSMRVTFGSPSRPGLASSWARPSWAGQRPA